LASDAAVDCVFGFFAASPDCRAKRQFSQLLRVELI